MGYSGLVVIARSDMRLDELACIDDLFVAVTDTVRANGWRIGFLGPVDDASPADLARDLVAETGAPAVVLSVFDSDVADAVAIGPSGHVARFYLNEEMARQLVDDETQVVPRNDAAVAGLLKWAVEANTVANRDRLVAALAQSPGPFGAGVIELATALWHSSDIQLKGVLVVGGASAAQGRPACPASRMSYSWAMLDRLRCRPASRTNPMAAEFAAARLRGRGGVAACARQPCRRVGGASIRKSAQNP